MKAKQVQIIWTPDFAELMRGEKARFDARVLVFIDGETGWRVIEGSVYRWMTDRRFNTEQYAVYVTVYLDDLGFTGFEGKLDATRVQFGSPVGTLNKVGESDQTEVPTDHSTIDELLRITPVLSREAMERIIAAGPTGTA